MAQQSALDQERHGQQRPSAGNTLAVAKHRRRIREQAEVRHLPITASIARIPIETHRYRFRVLIVVFDRSRVARRVLRRPYRLRLGSASHRRDTQNPHRRCRRHLAHYSTSPRDQRQLLQPLAPRGPYQLADCHLAHAQPLRHRSVAQTLSLESFDQTQPLTGNPPPSVPPPLRASQPHHRGLGVSLLLPAHRAHARPARRHEPPRSVAQTRCQPTSPSHTPRPPHRRRNSGTRAALRLRLPVDLPPCATCTAHW